MKSLNEAKKTIVFILSKKLYKLSWVDYLIMANTSKEEQKLKLALEKNFKTEDRGENNCFLGKKIENMRHKSVKIRAYIMRTFCRDPVIANQQKQKRSLA